MSNEKDLSKAAEFFYNLYLESLSHEMEQYEYTKEFVKMRDIISEHADEPLAGVFVIGGFPSDS